MKQNHSASGKVVSGIQKMPPGFVHESDYLQIASSVAACAAAVV